MNVNSLATRDYENISDWTLGENKPKTNPIQTQTNPISQRVKLMQSVYLQRIIKKNADKGFEKTKPKQTQFKPNLVRRRRIPKGQNEINIACQKIWPPNFNKPKKILDNSERND